MPSAEDQHSFERLDPSLPTLAELLQADLAVRDVDRIRAEIESIDDAAQAFIVDAYDEEIWYVDEQLGRLRNELARRGRTDSSVVVITSDHGEELFDHGGFEHGHSVHQELLRVPLGVLGPGIPPARIDGAVAVQEAKRAGVDWQPDASDGRFTACLDRASSSP